ncbi:PKD domain-containing protein, partial [Chloroflexi bacterium TSY]|nr:PKD domain-containing protein [Chloroflexi bacterium TSY]
MVDWQWNFGDGATSTEQHPFHIYPAPGSYPVGLTITDEDGNADTSTMTYTVLSPPTAAFVWSPDMPDEGQVATLTDTSTDVDGAVVGWRWQFAHTNEQTTQNTSTSFPDNGGHVVRLTATDSQLLTTTVSQTITVLNAPPTANAGSNQVVVWGQDWAIDSTVFDPSSADRAALDCDWDFGDGQSAQVLDCYNSSPKVVHTYTVPGVYTATDRHRQRGRPTAATWPPSIGDTFLINYSLHSLSRSNL